MDFTSIAEEYTPRKTTAKDDSFHRHRPSQVLANMEFSDHAFSWKKPETAKQNKGRDKITKLFKEDEWEIIDYDEEKKQPATEVKKRQSFKRRYNSVKSEIQLTPDIVQVKDRSLHGWLDKRSKKRGFFSSWKRMFVTIEHQKLRYFKDV